MSTDGTTVELSPQEYVRRLADFLADQLAETIGEKATFTILVFDGAGEGTVMAAGTAEIDKSAGRIREFLEKHKRVEAAEPNSSAKAC